MELGIDVLADNNYAQLRGKRVGLITNHTGVNSRGVRTRVLLKRNCNLVALYTPEHGLEGREKAGRYVKSHRDPVTGLTAYSLYGPTRKPTPTMLRGIDVLVFDIQDIGCRAYTYISTMGLCMEAAAKTISSLSC
ncbi:MAG: exo-beta-N-acetylmuramidase NamZ domain-containing protein, partial [Chthoniobacterales bacterium]